jgi:hypothetical protein
MAGAAFRNLCPVAVGEKDLRRGHMVGDNRAKVACRGTSPGRLRSVCRAGRRDELVALPPTRRQTRLRPGARRGS